MNKVGHIFTTVRRSLNLIRIKLGLEGPATAADARRLVQEAYRLKSPADICVAVIKIWDHNAPHTVKWWIDIEDILRRNVGYTQEEDPEGLTRYERRRLIYHAEHNPNVGFRRYVHCVLLTDAIGEYIDWRLEEEERQKIAKQEKLIATRTIPYGATSVWKYGYFGVSLMKIRTRISNQPPQTESIDSYPLYTIVEPQWLVSLLRRLGFIRDFIMFGLFPIFTRTIPDGEFWMLWSTSTTSTQGPRLVAINGQRLPETVTVRYMSFSNILKTIEMALNEEMEELEKRFTQYGQQFRDGAVEQIQRRRIIRLIVEFRRRYGTAWIKTLDVITQASYRFAAEQYERFPYDEDLAKKLDLLRMLSDVLSVSSPIGPIPWIPGRKSVVFTIMVSSSVSSSGLVEFHSVGVPYIGDAQLTEVAPKHQFIGVGGIRFTLPQHYVDEDKISIYRTNITGCSAAKKNHYLVIVAGNRECFTLRVTSHGIYYWESARRDWIKIGKKKMTKHMNLLNIPSFSKFNSKLTETEEDEDRLENIMSRLRQGGSSRPLQRSQILCGGVLIELPKDYPKLKKIAVLRSHSGTPPRGKSYYVAISDESNPNNFLIFERLRDGVYLLGPTPRKDEKIASLPGKSKAAVCCSIIENPRFKLFDEAIEGIYEERRIWSPDGKTSATICFGNAHFKFSGKDSFIIRRRKGGHAGYGPRGRSKYTLEVFRDNQGRRGEKITVISWYDKRPNEFTIEGIGWNDGQRLVLRGRYFFVPRILDKIRRGEFRDTENRIGKVLVARGPLNNPDVITPPVYITETGKKMKIKDYDLRFYPSEGIYKLVPLRSFTFGEPSSPLGRKSHNLRPAWQFVAGLVTLAIPGVGTGFLRVGWYTYKESFLQFLKNNLNRGSPLQKLVVIIIVLTIGPFFALFAPVAFRTKEGQIIWHINPNFLPDHIKASVEIHEAQPTELRGLIAQAIGFINKAVVRTVDTSASSPTYSSLFSRRGFLTILTGWLIGCQNPTDIPFTVRRRADSIKKKLEQKLNQFDSLNAKRFIGVSSSASPIITKLANNFRTFNLRLIAKDPYPQTPLLPRIVLLSGLILGGINFILGIGLNSWILLGLGEILGFLGIIYPLILLRLYVIDNPESKYKEAQHLADHSEMLNPDILGILRNSSSFSCNSIEIQKFTRRSLLVLCCVIPSAISLLQFEDKRRQQYLVFEDGKFRRVKDSNLLAAALFFRPPRMVQHYSQLRFRISGEYTSFVKRGLSVMVAGIVDKKKVAYLSYAFMERDGSISVRMPRSMIIHLTVITIHCRQPKETLLELKVTSVELIEKGSLSLVFGLSSASSPLETGQKHSLEIWMRPVKGRNNLIMEIVNRTSGCAERYRFGVLGKDIGPDGIKDDADIYSIGEAGKAVLIENGIYSRIVFGLFRELYRESIASTPPLIEVMTTLAVTYTPSRIIVDLVGRHFVVDTDTGIVYTSGYPFLPMAVSMFTFEVIATDVIRFIHLLTLVPSVFNSSTRDLALQLIRDNSQDWLRLLRQLSVICQRLPKKQGPIPPGRLNSGSVSSPADIRKTYAWELLGVLGLQDLENLISAELVRSWRES
ncbi:MAG: hypothetical protein NC908_02730, partial [Candidatus Omnitrophica bacterium]|nr:hypothetical protein [Candidatus Omnitrophota bacterium]